MKTFASVLILTLSVLFISCGDSAPDPSSDPNQPTQTMEQPTDDPLSPENAKKNNPQMPSEPGSGRIKKDNFLAGTWYGEWKRAFSTYQYTLVFTNDGLFKRKLVDTYEQIDGSKFEPTIDRGIYTLDKNKLTVFYLEGINYFSKRVYDVSERTADSVLFYNTAGDDGFDGFNVKLGKVTDSPKLEADDMIYYLSWMNYFKLPGQWESDSRILKFMGNSNLFMTKQGNKNDSDLILYSTLGMELHLTELAKPDDDPYYKGTIVDLSKKRLVLRHPNGALETFHLKGEPQLTAEEQSLYRLKVMIDQNLTQMALQGIGGAATLDEIIWEEREW